MKRASLKKKQQRQTANFRRAVRDAAIDWNRELIGAFTAIYEHAGVMAGKTAAINDRSSPIRATCATMLARLGAPIVKPPHVKHGGEIDDIGQGEGCEGGKCVVRRGV